jgi:uncharacterized protein with von Willebrand factor type A (vWA) domain
MTDTPMNDTAPPHSRIADNIVYFARVLRTAGLPIGPDRVVDAVKAVQTAGLERRDDFYWTLASVLIGRREHFELFDQAFRIFWRDPKLLERAMSLAMPANLGHSPREENAAAERLAEAMFPALKNSPLAQALPEKDDAPPDTPSFSHQEMLRHADFEGMSAAELAEAKRMIARLSLPIPEIRTRRLRSDARGERVDARATLRSALRASGGDIILLRRSAPRYRHPPLVVLCDVSGSMSRYSRMFLHFLHAITSDRDRVTSFAFGTRLTNITRQLRHRDVDVAMDAVMAMIRDWAGGTRIGHCLAEFNLRWSRRVLAQNATVLLMSDGLDGDIGAGLSPEMERLHKSCRQLIWLNPLLRWQGFEARPAGIRAMLPHVDAFLPAHNVDSLVDLGEALSARGRRAPLQAA